MKNLVLIVCFMLFLFISLLAQSPDTLWTRTFGGDTTDVANSVQQTSDGGYIITGYTTSSGAGNRDVWLIKTDMNGDTLWTKTFGGTGFDEGNSVQQTTDGGYIIAGQYWMFSQLADVWLVKANSGGDTIWTKSFGGNSIDVGYSVQHTSDGGYIVTGIGGGSYLWLIKTDNNGDTLWTKSFDGIGYSVQQTADGGYIITGLILPSGVYPDILLIKTDENGDSLWTRSIGGDSADVGYSVQQTSDGGYIITGLTQSFGAGHYDVWLIKTDSNGNTLWTKTFGGNNWDQGSSVQQTSDGGYIVAGYTYSFGTGGSDIWVIKTNASGDTLWTKALGGNGYDFGSSVRQTADGGYIIAGTISSSGEGSEDVWLIKIAPDVTAIDENPQIVINNLLLKKNYPNPFNPATSIQYSIRNKYHVLLKVYNLLGKEIATLVNEEKPAGVYSVEFDASRLPSGIYFYQLQAGDFTETKKMILMR